MFRRYAIFVPIFTYLWNSRPQMECHRRNQDTVLPIWQRETEDSFMTTEKLNLATGITTAEARVLQDKYGKNELTPQKRESFIKKAFHVICEPMFYC